MAPSWNFAGIMLEFCQDAPKIHHKWFSIRHVASAEVHNMTDGAACRNFGAAPTHFAPPVPLPLAQTARQGSMETIPDLFETWLITTTGLAGKLTKRC